MEKRHPLVADYKDTILGFDPPAFAKMNEPGSEHKYTKIYRRLSYDLIQSHLRGDVTVAVCLINPAGSARAAVLDIDEGGAAALISVLQRAEARRLTAFAQSSTNAEHDGGHVWLLFDGWRDPARFRFLADTLAQDSNVKAESYPTRKAIRLPLGIHRWTGKRGHLFLPAGTVLDLDEEKLGVQQAIQELRRLPQNPINLLPDLPKTLPRTAKDTAVSRSKAHEIPHNFISNYNHSTDIIALLERFGGHVAQWFPSGGALMHCPCPHHKHKDARPSIEIQPAKNTSRYGEFVIFGYAPECLFYTERGQVVDAFSAYCKLHNLTPDEAVKLLSNS